MKYLLFCLVYSTASVAQSGTVYPSAAQLRATLLQLIESKRNAFQDIKGAPLNKKGTTQYYKSTLHIVPNDTPRIAEDTNPLQAYYLDFLNKGLEEELSKSVFKEWQRLIAAALPAYSMSMTAQYATLESRDFISPDQAIKLTIYRNVDKDKWQISIAIINSNLNELLAAVDVNKKPVPVKPVLKEPAVKPVPKEPAVKPPSTEQKTMQETIARVLKDRLNGFQSFKDATISGKGTASYTVKGTDYPFAEDLVEFIEVPKNGPVTYTVILSGSWEANEVAAAYQQALTADLKLQGYKYNNEQVEGKTKTYSITYKGSIISKCIFKEDGKDSETTIKIYGK